MDKVRGKILWVDDEIDHLKPHILFLEEKGYQLTTTTNGQDAVTLVAQESFHLALLDQFMPGMDGMDTLRRIKEIKPNLPVIMITKSEEEWLMDEAISEKVAQFLIKPVNPTQIFMACKQVLEETKIREEKATSGYLRDFQEIEHELQESMTVHQWWDLYNRLVKWQLEFDVHRDTGLGNILAEQVQTCNREFVHYIESNYQTWLHTDSRPALSVDVLPRYVLPLLKEGKKVCLIVVDSLRHDQLMTIIPDLNRYFDITVDFHISILPSATPFSRNAIFSGLFPDELLRKYPQQRAAMEKHATSLNQFEAEFLQDLLKRHGLGKISVHYHKIWQVGEGRRFQNRVSEYLKVDLLSVVVNFVDLLAHKRSESDVLKEMVPDESGYRYAVKTWFAHSWLYETLVQLSSGDFTVVLTSDHGSLRVQRGVVVGADRESSTGVRYKYGRNLNCSDKNALVIRKPADYRLPELGPQTSFLIAKDDVYFLYPTQYHKYQSLYKESFQHGGISMEEMLVPVVTLQGTTL
jgi:CheY-like chemotaxis protein